MVWNHLRHFFRKVHGNYLSNKLAHNELIDNIYITLGEIWLQFFCCCCIKTRYIKKWQIDPNQMQLFLPNNMCYICTYSHRCMFVMQLGPYKLDVKQSKWKKTHLCSWKMCDNYIHARGNWLLEINCDTLVTIRKNPFNLCPIYLKFTWALATLSEPMHKKFEVAQTKIKGWCQSETKLSQLISNSQLPLEANHS